MDRWKPFVELKTRSGTPVRQGGITITPEAQALLVKLPFMGFAWNRSVAVVVEKTGRRERIAIRDQTRAAVLIMVGVGSVVSFATFMAGLLARES